VRMTAPLMRCSAARMSSMVGGCMDVVWSTQRGLAVHLGTDNAKRAV
jgi:hypothetical protein